MKKPLLLLRVLVKMTTNSCHTTKLHISTTYCLPTFSEWVPKNSKEEAFGGLFIQSGMISLTYFWEDWFSLCLYVHFVVVTQANKHKNTSADTSYIVIRLFISNTWRRRSLIKINFWELWPTNCASSIYFRHMLSSKLSAMLSKSYLVIKTERKNA